MVDEAAGHGGDDSGDSGEDSGEGGVGGRTRERRVTGNNGPKRASMHSAVARASWAGNARAPSEARQFVRTALRGWDAPSATTDDVTLLASELVTNAVVHAGTPVRLECRHEGGSIAVEVADGHPTRVVETAGAGEDVDGALMGQGGTQGPQGQGLRVVAALAGEWGVTYRRDGKTVWFRLPCRSGAVGASPPSASATGGGDAAAVALATSSGPGAGLEAPPAGDEDAQDVREDPAGLAGAGPRAADASPAELSPAVEGGTVGPGGVRATQPRHVGQDPADRDPAVPAAPEEDASHGTSAGGLVPQPQRSGADVSPGGPDRTDHGVLSFLAETSDLLSGQTDEDRVASLACQLLVPRFADWCAVWLADPETSSPIRLARVWHTQEERMDELRAALKRTPPEPGGGTPEGKAVPWTWPGQASAYGPGGAAAGCELAVGGRSVGTLVIGRAGLVRLPGEVVGIVEDFARRVAQAVLSARRYKRQATISRVLQRGLLPSGDVAVPGVETAVVYEPAGEGSWAGGDFYDFFEGTGGRWRFALGDVCGNGPEAAVVTGLARPVLRLLAREGHSVTEVMDRLNREVGEQTRFLTMIYGELAPRPASEGGGSVCTLVCAGHPLPLIRDVSGKVRAAAQPQMLLGVEESVGYESQSVVLEPGETLLCVTDGVTERRSGQRQFDDEDGLATVFGDCGGLDAAQTAERIRRAVHAFGAGEPADDLALLVLQAKGR